MNVSRATPHHRVTTTTIALTGDYPILALVQLYRGTAFVDEYRLRRNAHQICQS